MKIENFIDDVQRNPLFHSALPNIKTHMHSVPLLPWGRALSYYNQPILVELSVHALTPGPWHLSFEQLNSEYDETILLPFPCVEYFCPSFNAPNSLFIDVYEYAVSYAKRQFSQFGLPIEFFGYNPISIKCEKALK